MNQRMKFEELDEYKKDVKKLLKRFRTLQGDITIVKQVLAVEPKERPPFSYRIDGLGIQTCIIKVRKMACRSLKGKGANTGLRVVYAHFEEEQKIVLIELYFKGDKEKEDRDRILKHFK